MNPRYTRTVAPSSEPLTAQEAKHHLGVTVPVDDTLINGLILTAREYVESITNRALITQTWKLYLDYFPQDIEVPRNPLQSVTSITYVDTDGAIQTVSSSIYTVDSDSEKGLIYEAYNQDWPATRDVEKAVTVTFVAGYGDRVDVPQTIKWVMLLLIGHFYENREIGAPITIKEVPMAFDTMIAPYKMAVF